MKVDRVMALVCQAPHDLARWVQSNEPEVLEVEDDVSVRHHDGAIDMGARSRPRSDLPRDMGGVRPDRKPVDPPLVDRTALHVRDQNRQLRPLRDAHYQVDAVLGFGEPAHGGPVGVRNAPEEDRGFDLKLVNAKHVKMVPGRKTDLADAAWLARAAGARPAGGVVRAAGADP